MFKRLMVLILLLAALSAAAPSAQAQLITALAHRNTDADAPEDPQIATSPLDEDALTFVDRTHQYNEVPEFLVGAEYILLANDNKNVSAYEVDITLAKSAIVYVFVDNRMGGAAGGLGVDPIITGMPWLTDMGFVDTGEDIGIDESADGDIDQYSSIFALEVKAGVVTIGGCTQGHGGNMLGVAVLPAPTSETATNPVPADAATDVVREIVLQWTPGETAVTHDIYFGTVFDDVNAASRANPLGVLVSQGQGDASYDPAGLLEFGTTYYWRIDEVNAPPDSTIFKGEVWSFTTEPFAYPITGIIATSNATSNADTGPERTIDGSGLNAADAHSAEASDMWLGTPGAEPPWIQFEFDKVYKLHELLVWNYNVQFEPVLGFGVKDVTIEYSSDGAEWVVLGDAQFARATAKADYTYNTAADLAGVAARYVRLNIKSGWGMLGQYGLSEVRFTYIPVQARQPQPADGATDVAPDAALSWRAGREAASHDVYIGTDPENLPLANSVAQNTWAPDTLNYGATYYWKVDEVGADSLWAGEVWSFSTQQYALVDGFESYNDDLEAGTTIFDTWLDGWVNDTGSTVGYLSAPFAEQTIVHSGTQSMPLTYDNTTSPFYSEAERQFDEPQDWTANGIKSLSLYFRGAADNTGRMYVKINNTKIAYDGDPADIAKTAWLPWNIDLSAVGNLRNVTTLIIGVEGSGTTGILYIDDIRLYPRAPEYITPTEPDAANLLARYEFEGNANDSSGNGLNGVVVDGQFVASGRPGDGMALQVNDAGYADLGNPALLDFSTGDWTVTAWYKTGMTGTGDDNKGTIYGKGGDTGGGHRYCLIMSETTEGVVTLITDDDVTKYVVDSTSVTNDDEWHSVAGQRQGADLRIFIDGQLERTVTATATYNLAGTSQHNAYIGAITNHTAGGLYKLYIGLLDDVRVYNKALSEGEILWLAGVTEPVAKPF